MRSAVLDAIAGAALSTIERLKLTAELVGLVKKRAEIPAGPMAALQTAKLASQMIAVLAKLGVDLKAKDREDAAFAPEGEPDVPEAPRALTAVHYDFDPNRKTAQRRKDNSAAVDLLRKVDAGEVDGASLTADQKAILARYSGTGGNLINADTGKKGSAYEYYTPKPIAEGMWDLLGELGFKGGKVLDPCAGVGIFGATAPANAAIEAVELNEVSGRVNQLVNGGPGYNAIISPFEAVAARTPDEVYDAVVSNVPFGGVHDRGSNRMLDDRYQDQPLETYFILRSLEKLKPGGLAAFIVPPRVVSGKGGRHEQLRVAASYMAEFMGAYRLPNSVFGAADADTITDVIVFRKFSREAGEKVAEIKEQSPATLVKANVQWTEFVSGDYFKGEGRRFVLGEFVAKDPTKFRDVDRVVNTGSVADIAKLLRKFPGSRIDWALLEATETQPIVYNDGDTMTLAGQTLEMRDGVWVAVGKPQQSVRWDGVGQALSNAAAAVANKVDWPTARDYVAYLSANSMALDMPDWLRIAHRDVSLLDPSDQAKLWAAVCAGMAVVEVMRAHSDEPGFNYAETYPAIHEALAAVATTCKKAPGAFSSVSKQAMVKVGIVYDRRIGYSAVWMGEVSAGVLADKALGADAAVEAIKYRTKGITIPVDELKSIYGEEFDPLTDDAWCLNADGTQATKADDYYTGNLGDFLARIDAEIKQASGPLREKLLRQKAVARERVSTVDPGELRFNLFTPFVTLEEKAEFLRRFMHPAFVVGHNEDGEKVIMCDIASPKSEHERQLKRFAEYLKRGNLSTRTTEADAAKNPELDAQRRKMLREMAATKNAQFDQWTKANPVIMERMRQEANDPARLYFNEIDDSTPLAIDGMGQGIKLHGYQNAFVRKQARSFGGINGFDVGLGKTFTALASAQYVQSIGVKKKTIFVVPNSVLSNWRREAGRAYASLDDCLFVGLDISRDGKAVVNSSSYARDFNRVLENKHAKIFCTLEAFKTIPLKDETVAAYQDYLSQVDPSFDGGDRTADSERAESKMADATSDTGAKSAAIPFFEEMGIDSIVMDEGHMYKNSKNTVEFSGAKFLSVAEASQRGLDVQMKAWYVRKTSPTKDGVLVLTATPITNSPLEIYSMLCLSVGEQKVHDLTMGARGADEFMEVMCDIEDDEETTIDGRTKPYRVFRGLQNVNLLRQAISTVATIKTGEDVKLEGDDLKLPEAPDNKVAVTLAPQATTLLNAYKVAYRAARFMTGMAAKDQEPPTEEEMKVMEMVQQRFGEPLTLIAHPFNLINKMTMVIADPELDERATFYRFSAPQAELAQQCVKTFNALGRIEVRMRPGPWTAEGDVVGTKVTRDGDNEIRMYRIRVQAVIAKDGRIAVDTLDPDNQAAFEAIAEKAGLDLDCSIPPKFAALLENVRREEANPRSTSGRVKQIIFCDILPSHNKIKRLLVKHAGYQASAIAIITGQSIKNPEQLQAIQDGFNAEGEDNKYRVVIANEKAEVGINLQKGTQAIHHLTIGWTPDSTIQRNGRGVRQGNTTATVNIYHYDANGTFDTYKRNLTSRKADWIGSVMDRQGGNEVAVQGGLTNDQYDELIEAMGNEGAMDAIRQRAELKERAARAASARARQVINIQTAAAQDAFQKKYPTAKNWVLDKALRLYDMVKAVEALEVKAGSGKMSAASLMKLETRKAEMLATIQGLESQIDGSTRIGAPYGYRGDRPSDNVGIMALIGAKSHYSLASKVREQFADRVMSNATQVLENSEVDQEWQAEVAAAEEMKRQALKDFERISAQDEAYPPDMVKAFADGMVTIIDGQPYARGQFVYDKAGQFVGVVRDTTWVAAFPRESFLMLADAVSTGCTFTMFGTPEHERAISEAAALDDGIDSIRPDQVGLLYSSIVPDVATRRNKVTMVRYSPRAVELPAPYFRFPVNPAWAGISEALAEIGRSQSLIRSWEADGVLISSAEPVVVHTNFSNASGIRVQALADRAKATGQGFTLNDYLMLAFGDTKTYNISAVTRVLQPMANWQADYVPRFAAFNDLEALSADYGAAVREAYTGLLVIGPNDESGSLVPYRVADAFNRRANTIKMVAEAARRAEEAAANPAPAPTQPDAPAPAQAVAAAAPSGITLSPWVSGKTGEKRVYFNDLPGASRKESIYASARDDGIVKITAWHEMPAERRNQFVGMVQDFIRASGDGTVNMPFDKLWEMAGVKTDESAAGAPSAGGLIGITGNTRANMDLIKRAAMQAGGRAQWVGAKVQWNVPAAAWDILMKMKPELATELQSVPA